MPALSLLVILANNRTCGLIVTHVLCDYIGVEPYLPADLCQDPKKVRDPGFAESKV